MTETILVSACLLGLLTRYDGTEKRNPRVLDFISDRGLVPIPICPEQLAGLPTPRPPVRFSRADGTGILDGTGSLIDEDGNEFAQTFLKGAMESVKIARLTGCRKALLKERSPSCGVSRIYRGEALTAGQGVTCALLRRNGLQVFSEEDL